MLLETTVIQDKRGAKVVIQFKCENKLIMKETTKEKKIQIRHKVVSKNKILTAKTDNHSTQWRVWQTWEIARQGAGVLQATGLQRVTQS